MKLIRWILAVLACILFVACPVMTRAEKKPVILDADMVDLFDDGMAMVMLAKAPNIDLLGVSVVIGNTWVETGTASAIRQLEGLGKAQDIPVYMGINTVTRAGRLTMIEKERQFFGKGPDSHLGAAGYAQPASWKEAYKANYGEEPTAGPMKENAVDFIIRTVKERPHEVTIVSIGTSANLAAALRKAPEIAPLVKQVCYMGGAFFVNGNVSPAAEFNFWMDPESSRIALRAPWGEQLIAPLDVCEKVFFTKARYDRFTSTLKTPLFKDMWEKHWMTPLFRSDDKFRSWVWDVISAAAVIDPSVITEEVTYPVDINDTYSLSYGQSLAFKGFGPEGSQKARIILSVDEEKLWNMIYTAEEGL